ncbi:hypothetical protein [Flexistipes sp.]|uniref:hypothetical protein n=1 Tax=Flexistipes sp. TaxID=3088135 RepID=UPI002E1A1413|nr:hypothetical protein [Flexistipes sp.]
MEGIKGLALLNVVNKWLSHLFNWGGKIYKNRALNNPGSRASALQVYGALLEKMYLLCIFH